MKEQRLFRIRKIYHQLIPIVFIDGIKKRLSPGYKGKKNMLWMLLSYFFNIYTWLKFFYRERILSERNYIKRHYRKTFGSYPNLIKPTLFSEKIQWLKLNQRTALHTICADKFKVRGYVKERTGDVVLFSAAIPYQGGDGHINEQFPEYWGKIFATYGFVPIDIIRPQIWRNKEIAQTWVRQNLLIFVKKDLANRFPKKYHGNINCLTRLYFLRFLRIQKLYKKLTGSNK
ncbi:MAG: hypothetical protein HQ522_17605 [Bacteroidetes bacterium]|nr:hypothetical protein [Bacteroidota bacterium]